MQQNMVILVNNIGWKQNNSHTEWSTYTAVDRQIKDYFSVFAMAEDTMLICLLITFVFYIEI